MNRILKFSQNKFFSLVLYLVALALVFFKSPITAMNPLFLVVFFIIAMLVFWGMSRLLKLQNSNIFSAMSLMSLGAIFSFLSNLFSGIQILSLILGIVGSLLSFVLFKYIYQTGWGRTIWLVILNEIIICIILVGFILAFSLQINQKQQSVNENTLSTQDATNTSGDSYVGWNNYTDKSISFKYPPNWKVYPAGDSYGIGYIAPQKIVTSDLPMISITKLNDMTCDQAKSIFSYPLTSCLSTKNIEIYVADKDYSQVTEIFNLIKGSIK